MIPNGTARIRALIVDDEPLARNNLAILLRRDADIEVIGECGTGADAVEQIRHHKPDLVFLDVQMPECDGFDVLELLGGDAPPVIIFVTAYDEYALRAFEAGALDYLLKPFEDSRFNLALGRAKEKLAQGKSLTRTLELLAIKSTGLIFFVKIREIDWIEAADYYACLHLAGKTHLLRRSIADLEQELDPKRFCRIHRSTIVNLERIQGLKVNREGEYDVILRDGTRLRLSRGYRRSLQLRMGI